MSSGNYNHTPSVAQGASTHQPTTAPDYVRPSAFRRDIQANERGWQLAVDSDADENVLPNGLGTVEREARQDPTPGERRFLAEDIARDDSEIIRQEEVIEDSRGAITEHEETVFRLKGERTEIQRTGLVKTGAIIPVVFGQKPA